ncbi:ethanol acetyltransferase 1 [Trichonephila inaurata madagascariensis]|uniref:sn-1-specific diacylglycerol lipase ABHD11 n=1 Tax=Trichonephila inaurata madagascariensis TaxID=2747483 RepID=A0A8X6X1A3_9ARAC|nr:ethanol acetyltransferase 1 [Trichonephila inaurata madagascariensis]
MTKYTPVKLAFSTVEPDGCETDKAPIVLLHGITASKEYWNEIPQNIANATKRKVYAIDARNHGDSEWSDVFDFDCNVDDFLHFMDQNGISKAILIGHSMGGITAYKTALAAPERVEKLVVEDMSPKKPPKQILDLVYLYATLAQLALQQVPVGSDEETARNVVIDFIEKSLPKEIQSLTRLHELRLQLKPTADGKFEFKSNIMSLIQTLKNSADLMLEPSGVYDKPTCFIYGELSPFRVNSYEEEIKKLFPNYKLVGIPNAMHTVHNDCPKEFTDAIIKFIQE